MLTKDAFKDSVQKLIIFYPSWGIKTDDKTTMQTWFNMMKVLNVTDESLCKAVTKHIKEVKFNPTIATLIECGLGKRIEKTDTTGFIDLDAERTDYE